MQVQAKITTEPHERRRHARVKLSLLGRYMLEDRREFPCQTIDVSVGGLALTAPVKGEIGERVVAYFDALGRIEGNIVRHLEHGFAMTAVLTTAKREKLVNQLTWLVNRETLGLPEDRRHERIIPKEINTIIRLPDGSTAPAKIVDISISGAAVTCTKGTPLGAMIQVGRRRARVVRVFDHGLALEFALPLSFDQFDENVVL
ncbi:PilZ domain-containing protein [Rhodoblastus acidophilus]|jgi:c-di-GMP-binding flagellar brake protein YcgR|uniref:PilZ domain-containing protein n=1 Tax=Candidatus Rhodoblastus alkanivorans TaxID=2954117 RepID=A0ABS9Z997_9HYPH|nr:PilZ domain-containing protein [Candidatus Rhodoblastus alkanivorans]MCI4679989.1 PilZ domain-containing protein [Candidatus Rhodoblastus alkanivorans]MCI4684269.1 PilZ domain-containing protein [Candidatus Rhodoblastus alkanivorans]MDI4641589.1 PilZ domain-containing protein [Rhodoblastus acidophilus]